MPFDLRWQGLVDFAVLAAAIHLLLRWSQNARALRVTLGILVLETAALVSRQIDLWITAWILHATALGAGVTLIVLFQPELRHALNQLEVMLSRPERRHAIAMGFEAIATAAFSLAAVGRGALIVLTRSDPVQELVGGGVPLGGQVSVEILEAIFRKVSPVHDGATIIDTDRITRVGAVLPLSQRTELPAGWGTRHRAAMGLAEPMDAVVVVASEERREVTLVVSGTATVCRGVSHLVAQLRTLIPQRPLPTPSATRRPGQLASGATTLALALVIWAAASWLTGTVERTRTVPLDVTHVSPGLTVVDQTATSAQVRVRGAAAAVDGLDPSTLTAHLDLMGLEPGVHGVDVGLPSATRATHVVVEDVTPSRVFVRLVPLTDVTPKQ
jgi:diadenylate cyclase